MTDEPLQRLRQPFPKGTVGKLPKPYKKDSPRAQCRECGGYHGLPAVHLDYVGHAAVTDRLLNVDPEWSWEPMASDQFGSPMCDKEGNLWIKLTVAGVTRIGVGDGPNMKERVGDALRNAAMRFGVALDLWTKDELESELVAEVGHDKHAQQQEPAQQQEQDPLEVARRRAWEATSHKATSKEARTKLWQDFHADHPTPTVADFDRIAQRWTRNDMTPERVQQTREQLAREVINETRNG